VLDKRVGWVHGIQKSRFYPRTEKMMNVWADYLYGFKVEAAIMLNRAAW